MGYEENNKAALSSIANRQLTKSMQMLLGICTGIVADNHINDTEIHFLNTWLTEFHDVASVWPGYLIANRIRDALKDGIITEQERSDILETIYQLTSTSFTETGSAGSDFSTLPI